MELIIKPTGRCNFRCTFCSASELSTAEDPSHVHPELIKYINMNKPSGIIITGGDPLMMNPEYYYELHNIAGNGVNVSATTNLKDFFNNPDKWKDLFNESWFNVSTSFQYGPGRMWDNSTVYDEKMFTAVMKKFDEFVDKPLPSFISVISEDNEQFAIDHVLLAKKLGTKTKLNAALPVGKCSNWYPRYKMYQIYLDIINKYHLEQYESNCFDRALPRCPKNTFNTCTYNIRCCYVDGQDHLHVGICDEMLAMGDELTDTDMINCKVPSQPISPNEFINENCACCQLCTICNGCNLNRRFAVTDENYCKEMKKLEDQIVDAGWIL